MNKLYIKFLDGDGVYLGTISPKKLKNKIFFVENINGGQGELSLKFDADFDTYFNEAFFCELYTVDQDNPRGLLIYSGIIFKRIGRKSISDELELVFIGLASVLFNRWYYTYSSPLDYDFVINEDPSVTISNIIDETNTIIMTFSSIAGGPFTLGESITGSTSGAVGKIEYVDGTIYYISFISGIFQKLESVVGTVSLATATINWTYENIFWGKLSPGTITSYGTSFNSSVDYNYMGEVMDDIIRFSDNFYYYIDKNGVLIYDSIPSIPSHVLMFGGEYGIMEIEDNEDFSVYNSIAVEYALGIVEAKNTTSINKYGLREEIYTDVDIQDSPTAQQVANRLLAQKKDPRSEIKIKISKKYRYIETQVRWMDLLNAWNTYIDPWEEFGSSKNIHNITPGQTIDIRNIDTTLKYTNILVVRKEYYEDYIVLYCSNYFNFSNMMR